MLFLGIDAGTTALKAGLFDEQGRALAIAGEEYQLITPTTARAELDPETYWQACINTVRRVLAASQTPPEAVVALGVSSQGETLIAVDRRGHALRRAIVWLDNRASTEAERLAAQFDPAAVYETTGVPEIIATWTACKLLWLEQHEPALYQAAHKFLLVQDYLLYRLTGRFATDESLVCTTMLWNLRQRGWWDEMLAFLKLSESRLPEPLAPGAQVGTLTLQAAESLGLSTTTRVVACGMDQASGAVGAGNIHPGMISESTGGALAIQATVTSPDVDPSRRLPLYVHTLAEHFLVVPVCPTGGMALKWFRDTFGSGQTGAPNEGDAGYERLARDAAQIPPGCEGLTMLPHLMGAYSPEYNAQARGVFYGFTLRHSRAHFARAVFEAVAFMLKRNLDEMAALGIPAHSIRSMGGGAKSRMWLQIKADVTNLVIETLEQQETAILGNAIIAAVAVGAYQTFDQACAAMVRMSGQIEPQPALHDAYAEAYVRYCAVYDALDGLFRRDL
ncbi:MAG: hypothetical protein IT331_24795 [Anaerolineae bacterium]|nr:hypothetical protein [Anaerolineae bacterium]